MSPNLILTWAVLALLGAITSPAMAERENNGITVNGGSLNGK